ncbi:substrate-binding periplasmic protein [Roseateles toxinivorans]|uniref:Polar amino acid transport system substrate-binding protein n=1 Tax=Roseateles toxinivorans TaxID=270368 RepID=A0A4R6QJI4_9BURK|nr:transporter substrate-binding domain-containing protein [Roseateles toxinivorans]TDP63251.1 polar amino acid transport system substrate-binding protein [Roseateles toxinivorans]
MMRPPSVLGRLWRRALRWLAAVLSLQAAAALAAPAQPSCPERPIRVGLYELGPFHSLPRGARQGAGLDRDIVAELQKRSGCSFSFETMARARIWIELRAGRLDMTLSALHSDDRASYSWLHPLMQMQSLTLLPRELLPEGSSRSAFIARPGWVLGVVRGYQHQATDQAMIDALRAEQRVLEVVDQPALFAKLRAGQIHAMFSYPMVYRHYLQAEELQERFATTRWDAEEKSSLVNLALSKETFTAEQAQRWRRLTDQLSRDGTVERLLLRYVPPAEARGMLLPATQLAGQAP